MALIKYDNGSGYTGAYAGGIANDDETVVIVPQDVVDIQEEVDALNAEKAKYQTATGSDTIAITTGGDFALTQGNFVKWIQASANTGAVTINVDSKGAKALKNSDKQALVAGDLEAGKGYEAFYSLSDDFFVLPPRGAKLTDIITAIEAEGGTVDAPQKVVDIVNAINAVATWEPNLVAEKLLEGFTYFGVEGSLVQGVKSASGNTTPNSTTLTISGLDFQPSLVIIRWDDGDDRRQRLYWTGTSFASQFNVYSIEKYAPATDPMVMTRAAFTISSSGFSCPLTYEATVPVYWIAVE